MVKRKKSAAQRFGSHMIYSAKLKKCPLCNYEYSTLFSNEKTECPICKTVS